MRVALYVYGGFVVLNFGCLTVGELGGPKPTWLDYCRLAGFVLLGPLLWLVSGCWLLTQRVFRQDVDDA